MNTKPLAATAVSLLLMVWMSGCKMTAHETGFLGSYKNLEKDEADDALRYVDAEKVKGYKSFIVEPVQFVSHKGAKPVDPETAEAVTSAFHKDIVSKLEAANFHVVHTPGPGVARLRVAITDIDKSNPVLNIIPQTHLIGLGIGGTAMEAELIDCETGKQVAAVVQAGRGSRMSFAGMTSRTGDAKAVCAGWAEAFVKRLNKAHDR